MLLRVVSLSVTMVHHTHTHTHKKSQTYLHKTHIPYRYISSHPMVMIVKTNKVTKNFLKYVHTIRSMEAHLHKDLSIHLWCVPPVQILW